MRKALSSMAFKPRQLKEACQNETYKQKARIVCFSVLMGAIASGYQTYLDNLQFRAGIMQKQALGGEREWIDFKSKDSEEYWNMKNTYAFLDNKPLKDLKYLLEDDWKSVSYTDYTQSYNGTEVVYESSTAYAGPNGDEDRNDLYYTQTERDNTYFTEQQRRADLLESDPIAYYTEDYNEWVDMHEDLIWFDTSGCWEGGFIGDANKVRAWATTERSYDNGQTGESNVSYSQSSLDFTWWQYGEEPVVANYDQYGFVDNTSEATSTRTGWDTSVGLGGSLGVAKDDLYRDLLDATITFYDDCDLDCQKKGSQLTIVAILLSVVYGFVGLNALVMFCGAWRFRARVFSIYCTIFNCVFQFAVQIACGVMLFGNNTYNGLCYRSLTRTAGDGLLWTMSDDFMIISFMWIASWFLMFGFVCCGFVSTYMDEHKRTV